MADERRERLAAVIKPLLDRVSFSLAEAKQRCEDASPQAIVQTIRQLVREDHLRVYRIDDQEHYQWNDGATFEPETWIENQVNGNQVTAMPAHERPRERLLEQGPLSLSTADLIAVLIRVGVRNESAIVGGSKIANHYAEHLEDLATVSAPMLKAITPAATKASYSTIMAGIELGRRVAEAESNRTLQNIRITSTSEAIEYCMRHFTRLATDGVQEEFHIVSLDTKHKPIRSHLITKGTLDASLVHPREVFRPAITDSASAVLLVHNHPSGDATPSREDFQVTSRLTDAGKLIGISVLDHIVVARENAVSIRESE